ncbi:MAG: hypothetical protein A3J28_14795 [Acidobacteria bacterium RIFCSPLOWO2_12_FULL_60_22]|nr:MAG: hypothetical protein A3J28_14795 [Acidobacteria bacterium RIFCSPLOWO2_12_FULL_60_22]
METVSMSFSLPIVLGAVGALGMAAGAWLILRRKKKSASEIERERRLAVNAIGRITDGVLTESYRADGEGNRPGLVFFRYSAAGVEYSAAQDLSSLRHLVTDGSCSPGVAATVKYDPHHPSNSIILCESWSGLKAAGEGATPQGNGLEIASQKKTR